MIEEIYNEVAREFIRKHKNDSPIRLRLANYGKKPEFDIDFAITQIEAIAKCNSKIPFFLNHESFLIPDTSLAEQSSNQYISLLHAALVGTNKSVLDLTAGLGIDAFTLAIGGNNVSAIEISPFRAEILKHNSKILGIRHFKIYEDEAINWLSNNDSARYDWIFVDPARRSETNERSFLPEDSSPNVVANQELLLKHSDNILIKASPLLDISKAINDFSNIKTLYIVSYKGECKEVLIHLNSETLSATASVKIIDLTGADEFRPETLNFKHSFTTPYSELAQDNVEYANDSDLSTGKYLYESCAGMKKLQSPSIMMKHFPGIKSLSRNSNLYISEKYFPQFPGRISKVVTIPTGKELRKILKESGFRVVSSDYPVSASELRKKYKIKEGDIESAVFSRLETGKFITLIVSTL